jgi:hypothetical protein
MQELQGWPRGLVGLPMRKMMGWVRLQGLRSAVIQLLPLQRLQNPEKDQNN